MLADLLEKDYNGDVDEEDHTVFWKRRLCSFARGRSNWRAIAT
jgi:hypothetical protein